MQRQPVPTHPHYLHALDGLRFFAALFVACSHLVSATYKIEPQPVWVPYMVTLSGIGMTLFFVLSGFVIHYNYHVGTEGWTRKSLRYFAIARFSRLYPLLLLVILYDIYNSIFEYRSNFFNAHIAAPFYLTMTHSWFYMVLGNNSLTYQFAYYTSVAWSISVEVFLYLTYIPLALLFARVRHVRSLLLIGALTFALFAVFVYTCIHYYSEINAWAAAYYGPVADAAHGFQDSFVRWLLYFSPFIRLLEFILGCIAAKMVLHYRDTPPRLSRRTAGMLSLLVIVICLCLHVWLYHYSTINSFVKSQLYAPLIALLVYLVARYPSAVQSFLGSKLLCRGGDASYSIYLLHFSVIGYFSQYRVPVGQGLDGIVIVKYLCMLALIVSFARFMYLSFELPAKELIRRRMPPRALPAYLAGTWWKSRWLILLVLVLYNTINYIDKIMGSALAAL